MDSIFQASDVLLVIHRPEIIGITKYGLNNLDTKDVIYIHLLKVREGEPKILKFKNNLKYNSIDEFVENTISLNIN